MKTIKSDQKSSSEVKEVSSDFSIKKKQLSKKDGDIINKIK